MLHLAQSFSRFPSSPSLFASGLLNAIDGAPWALFFFLVGSHWQFCGFTCTHTHTWAMHTEEPHLSYRGTHTHTHVQHVHGAMERPAFGIWVVKFSQSSTEKPRSLASLIFSILLIPSAAAAAGGGGGVELFFFPTRKRPFVRFRSFVHSFFVSSFSFVSIQPCFFLTSIKDLHDNATTWKKKRKRVDRVHTPRYGGPLPFSLIVLEKEVYTS